MRLEQYLDAYQEMCSAVAPDLDTVKEGRTAWAIAGKAGVTAHAYSLGRDVVDAHIKTALVRIFPNAVFKDKYHY